jgi:hypothetical protein
MGVAVASHVQRFQLALLGELAPLFFDFSLLILLALQGLLHEELAIVLAGIPALLGVERLGRHRQPTYLGVSVDQ